MEIGVLVSDHVIDPSVAGDYPGMFRNLFARHSPDVRLRFYDLTEGEEPGSLDEVDLWVSGGSRSSVYEDLDHVRRLERLVVAMYETGTPFFGICFGHQMIAHALGGKVTKSERGWGVGVHTADVVEQAPWMRPRAERFGLIMSHQDQIEVLPPGGRTLASSSHCPVSMLAIGEHMAGVQGHPEFGSVYAASMLERRRSRIGDAIVDRALGSLADRTDDDLIVKWIVEFGRRAARRSGSDGRAH